jgi:Pyridoxal-phosphate dependent enzyme
MTTPVAVLRNSLFSLAELESVIPLVRASVSPTPQYAWPLLKAHIGVDVVVKHENHTPIGSFKVRGGLVYFERLKRRRPEVQGVVTATRGNHGQSLAFAGSRAGVAVTIVVPLGNSTEKNAAMRSLGAELIEHGRDFDDAKEQAARIATERDLEYAPSFHRDFVIGVATYAFELLTAMVDIDTVYVPIGFAEVCGPSNTRTTGTFVRALQSGTMPMPRGRASWCSQNGAVRIHPQARPDARRARLQRFRSRRLWKGHPPEHAGNLRSRDDEICDQPTPAPAAGSLRLRRIA